MLRIEGLVKNYGRLQVLRGIDAHIAPGEVVVLIGPSGSGKSTFLRCMNLLEKPTHGRIWFEGEEITSGGAIQPEATPVAAPLAEPAPISPQAVQAQAPVFQAPPPAPAQPLETAPGPTEKPLSGWKKFRKNVRRFIDYVDKPPRE